MQLPTKPFNCKTVSTNATVTISSFIIPNAYMYVMLNNSKKNKLQQICTAVKTDVIFMVNTTLDLPCQNVTNGTNNSVICDICGEHNTKSVMLTCKKLN